MQAHFIAFVFLLFCVASAPGQTVTKCVDGNGKISYSQAECAGQKSTVKTSQPASRVTPKIDAPDASLSALKNNVDSMRTEREFKDAVHRINVFTTRIDNWPHTRLEVYQARDTYVLCFPNSKALCLNLANRALIDADLSVEFSRLVAFRSAAQEEKSKARSEHFAITKKSLD